MRHKYNEVNYLKLIFPIHIWNEMLQTCLLINFMVTPSGVPRNFVRVGGSTNSDEDRGQRGRGSGGRSPLVRGSGGSCNLVQEISLHIVKFS